MAKSEEEPSARISIEATSQESLRKAKARLEEISEEKGILVVEPLG
jgi:ACT domain-containing protein